MLTSVFTRGKSAAAARNVAAESANGPKSGLLATALRLTPRPPAIRRRPIRAAWPAATSTRRVVNHVFVPGLIAGWAAFVAGCWSNFQLLRQNGRMLLRLEALEKRIEKFESGREDESERLLLRGANDYAPVEQSRLDSMRWGSRRCAGTPGRENRPCSPARCAVYLSGRLVKLLHQQRPRN